MTSNTITSVPNHEPGLFTPGDPTQTLNPPLNPQTSSYRLNHLAIRIKDPSRSLHFYINLLGMRVVFTMNAGPFTIYYLGHPPPDTKPEDLQNWAEHTSQIPNLTRTSGLLELYHVHGSEGLDENVGGGVCTGNEPPNLGFAHLGFTVPDVRVTVERLRGAGVRILKDVGGCERADVPLSGWEEERGVGVGEIHGNYRWFFEKFAVVADPVSWIFINMDRSSQDVLIFGRMGIRLN